MNKEELIKVLKAELKCVDEEVELFEGSDKDYFRGKGAAINFVICMLTSERYYKLVAKQNGIEVK